MTLTSTGLSMLTSFYFSDWGADRKGHYTHFHAQRLLYSLGAIMVGLQLWFWLVYVPVERCASRAARTAINDGASVFGVDDDRPMALAPRPASRRFIFRRMSEIFNVSSTSLAGSDGEVTRTMDTSTDASTDSSTFASANNANRANRANSANSSHLGNSGDSSNSSHRYP
mmetsp:Transcript_68568/g.135826  ORF Transcript_68568/g.135826 Transcript_68568/m.135826 type:complete len:170 (+) Transcript_68568:1559-2068(+)